jgi:hypothetical protein
MKGLSLGFTPGYRIQKAAALQGRETAHSALPSCKAITCLVAQQSLSAALSGRIVFSLVTWG